MPALFQVFRRAGRNPSGVESPLGEKTIREEKKIFHYKRKTWFEHAFPQEGNHPTPFKEVTRWRGMASTNSLIPEN